MGEPLVGITTGTPRCYAVSARLSSLVRDISSSSVSATLKR